MYRRLKPKVKNTVKRTGYVEGNMCEVLVLAKRDVGAPDKKMVPCRNLTKAEAFLPQEEVVAIARLAKNRVDVTRRQAATLQGRM
jgi:hypothetical protein